MKLSYLWLVSIGVAISLTSCFSSCQPTKQPQKVTPTTSKNSGFDWSPFYGKSTNLTTLAPLFGDADQALTAALATGNVILDFYTPWCPPCTVMAPSIDAAAREFTQVLILKIDVDIFSALATKYGIRSMPTLIYLQNGSVIARAQFMSEKALKKFIAQTFDL